jgi:hypothetical protein
VLFPNIRTLHLQRTYLLSLYSDKLYSFFDSNKTLVYSFNLCVHAYDIFSLVIGNSVFPPEQEEIHFLGGFIILTINKAAYFY